MAKSGKSRSRRLSRKPTRLKKAPLKVMGRAVPATRNAAPAATVTQKPFEYWSLPSEASVREKPPHDISEAAKRAFSEAVSAANTPTSEGEDVFINVGIDFGTSSTKVVVRLPFEAGQPSIAIPAPSFCTSNGDPYLWQTVLWGCPSGDYVAWPEQGAAVLHTLKQALLAGRHDLQFSLGAPDSINTTPSEAAAAYLCIVMRHVRAWLYTNRPKYFKRRNPVWTENIGFPTASLDNKNLVAVFRKVALTAHLASDAMIPLTCESIREIMRSPEVRKAAESEEEAATIGVSIIPETAAEVTGFFLSQRAAPGAYVLVDVGALTLDASFFRYSSSEYRMFNADVRPLGVESYHWFMNEGRSESEFSHQCDRVLWNVIWEGKNKFLREAQCWRPGNQLPVFLAGGGAHNELHRRRVLALGPWLTRHTRNDGIEILELPRPRTIDLPVPLADFGRLAVAWGLSFPAPDIGKVMRTSELTEVAPQALRRGPEYVSKDMV